MQFFIYHFSNLTTFYSNNLDLFSSQIDTHQCAMSTNDQSSNMVNSVESVDSSFTESNETCNDESNGEVEDYVVIMNPIITQDY